MRLNCESCAGYADFLLEMAGPIERPYRHEPVAESSWFKRVESPPGGECLLGETRNLVIIPKWHEIEVTVRMLTAKNAQVRNTRTPVPGFQFHDGAGGARHHVAGIERECSLRGIAGGGEVGFRHGIVIAQIDSGTRKPGETIGKIRGTRRNLLEDSERRARLAW